MFLIIAILFTARSWGKIKHKLFLCLLSESVFAFATLIATYLGLIMPYSNPWFFGVLMSSFFHMFGIYCAWRDIDRFG